MMLIIAVHRHNADAVGAGGKKMGKGGFQRRALAAINCMSQNFEIGKIFGRREIGQMRRIAAVVDNNDIVEPLAAQPFDNKPQLLIGVEGGENNGDLLCSCHTCTPFR